MRKELLHIWGPISIYSYGVAYAIALLVFMRLCLRHPLRKKLISEEKFIEVVMLSLVVGFIGSRTLFVLNAWHEMSSFWEIFAFWNGGFSLLGSFIAILIVIPWYLKKINVPVLPLLDLAALNAPVIHAIARLGCLMAGCCYGCPTTLPWAITYTDAQGDAPINVPLHPTQLYSSIAFFIVFLFLYFVVQKKVKHPGQLLMIYLMFESVIRFCMDFVRNDLEYFDASFMHIFSIHQWIALGMLLASIIGFILVSRSKNTYTEQA